MVYAFQKERKFFYGNCFLYYIKYTKKNKSQAFSEKHYNLTKKFSKKS